MDVAVDSTEFVFLYSHGGIYRRDMHLHQNEFPQECGCFSENICIRAEINSPIFFPACIGLVSGGVIIMDLRATISCKQIIANISFFFFGTRSFYELRLHDLTHEHAASSQPPPDDSMFWACTKTVSHKKQQTFCQQLPRQKTLAILRTMPGTVPNSDSECVFPKTSSTYFSNKAPSAIWGTISSNINRNCQWNRVSHSFSFLLELATQDS